MDGAGSKPAYNLRTLCRALEYARTVLPVYGLQRALYDGCSMAFHTQLAPSSAPVMEGLLQTHILGPGTKMKVRVLMCHTYAERSVDVLDGRQHEACLKQVGVLLTGSMKTYMCF